MIEIELPCCNAIARLESLEDEVRCESCGVVHEVARDAPAPEVARAAA